VPASPFERANGSLDQAAVADLLTRDGITGLGEAMDYLGLIGGHVSPLLGGTARQYVIDGHAPA